MTWPLNASGSLNMTDRIQQKHIQEHFERMFRAGDTPWVSSGPEPALEDFFELLAHTYPKARVLDIGCGNGWISIQAVQQGFEVWGIDSSETAIEEATLDAQAAWVTEKTHFQVGDVLDLPYEDHFFDAIIDRGLFHHILPENRALYRKNILRILKPKSVFYLAVFSTKIAFFC